MVGASRGAFFGGSQTIKRLLDGELSSKLEQSFHLEQELTHKEKLETINSWYRSQKLVIVLGAGASENYNLPDWNSLLQKLLLVTLLDDKGNNVKEAGVLAKTFDDIFKPNSLISARYLHNFFKVNYSKNKMKFEEAIRDELYAEVKTGDDSELLKEIRQFCIAVGKSPNLDSIITYNYDDLMELCLRNIDIDIPFLSVHARGMKHNQNELPIYHVHGYLPRVGKLTENNKVVLSEDGYHEQYTDVYGWSNLVQINKFKDHNCLFIGLSFFDPNLRRLLDIAKKERGDDKIHHYCFKKKHDRFLVKKRLETKELLDDKVIADIGIDYIVDKLIVHMEKFEENDAYSFGVGILWVNNYDEIPECLKEIRLALKNSSVEK